MTENLEKHLDLIFDEFDDMVKSNLFTREEACAILRQRKEFEYKVYAITKDIKSFQDYIKHEKDLSKDIKTRMEKMEKMKNSDRYKILQEKIIKRIRLLYEVAMQRFPHEISLLLQFLKYCKTLNMINAAKEAVVRVVSNNEDKPEVWQVAANWYAFDRNNMIEAMNLLFNATKIHPTSKILYKEMVEIEVYFGSRNVKCENGTNEEPICVKQLEEIIKTAFRNINDLNFFIQLLEILEPHKFTMRIQDFILEYIQYNYQDSELVWHTIAQRYYKGFVSDNDALKEYQSEKTMTPKVRLSASCAMYTLGIKTVPAANRQKLFELYIEFLLSLQRNNCASSVSRLNRLKMTLEWGHSKGFLSEKHYLEWTKYDKENRLFIIEKGTTAIPSSQELWKAQIGYHIRKENTSAVNQVFKSAILALGEKCVHLWIAIVQYHILKSSKEYVELIYKDAIMQPKEISDIMKPQYLRWALSIGGIERARMIYFRLAKQEPYCKELHVLMSYFESLQVDPDFESWTKVHEIACDQFGKDVELWINYIKFYLHFNKNVKNLDECVQTIYKRAELSLPKTLFYDFLTQYKNL